MGKLKVIVVGNGAREHALVSKILENPNVGAIYCAPGNAGTAEIAENLSIDPTDIEGLNKAIREKGIDLIIPGLETPLVAGIVDHFQEQGIPCFGPTKAASLLEADKGFSNELMEKYGIPHAKSREFHAYKGALDYAIQQGFPLAIKAVGLAAGKGVRIVHTLKEAEDTLADFMIKRVLKESGERVLISEFLTGRELSSFWIVGKKADGKKVVVRLGEACDYKLLQADSPFMTGGMGSYSPPEFVNEGLMQVIKETIVIPVVDAMEKEGRSFEGILYLGLMIGSDGRPKVLEINVRFGDPECQVILPRLRTDLIEVILAVLNGTLDQVKIELSEKLCAGAVMASQGYGSPEGPEIGFPISGLSLIDPDIFVFHGGTKFTRGQVVTDSGRVLTVVALGNNWSEVVYKLYRRIRYIKFEGAIVRPDIAQEAVATDKS